MKYEAVVFFYPSRIVGGAEFLFYRLAKKLSDGMVKQVAIIDYLDGFVSQINDGIDIIPYVEGVRVRIDYPVLVVTSGNYAIKLPKVLDLHNDSKVLIWAIHPHNFITMVPLPGVLYRVAPLMKKILLNTVLLGYKHYVHGFIDVLMNSRALVYMDYATYYSNHYYFDIDKNPVYLPIPIEDKQYRDDSEKANRESNCYNFCWLGRLSVDKAPTLIRLIEDLNLLAKRFLDCTFVLYVIGVGDELASVQRFTSSAIKNIKVVYCKTLIGRELTSFLKMRIDCVVAMGTSCLEAAILKIPSILVDPGIGKVRRNNYRWIYQTEEYTLGYLEKPSFVKACIDDLSLVVDTIKDMTRKDAVAEKCFLYVTNNHAIGSICEKFVSEINATKLTILTLRNIPPNNSLSFNIYSFLQMMKHVLIKMKGCR